MLQVVRDFVHGNGAPRAGSFSARVFLARDTRPSGERLLNAARQVSTGFVQFCFEAIAFACMHDIECFYFLSYRVWKLLQE